MTADETLAIAKLVSRDIKTNIDAASEDDIPTPVKPLIHNTARLTLGLFVNIARIADALGTLATHPSLPPYEDKAPGGEETAHD